MEHDDARPVDRAAHQIGQERQLRIARREHHVGLTAIRQRGRDRRLGVVGGQTGQLARVVGDVHDKGIDSQTAN